MDFIQEDNKKKIHIKRDFYIKMNTIPGPIVADGPKYNTPNRFIKGTDVSYTASCTADCSV